MHVSRGAEQCMFPLILGTLFACGIFTALRASNPGGGPVMHDAWKFRGTQGEDRVSKLHRLVNKQGSHPPREALLSIQTRTGFELRGNVVAS